MSSSESETASNFIDELLLEMEQADEQTKTAYHDLILLEIGKIEDQIARNFEISEQEIKIITDWAVKRNSTLQNRIDFLAMKLEGFIRERGVKSIDLAHGVLKIRKTPDKIEIIDLESFLANANGNTTTTVPESVKPDLSKIKSYIKKTGRIPEGIQLVNGYEKFSYKLKGDSNGESQEAGTGIEPADDSGTDF